MNNRELKAENEQLVAKVAELEAKLKEAADAVAAAQTAAAKPISKGKAQAEAAFALLKQGPVTMEQLAGINSKYPNDPIYFVRTILKQEVKTNRQKGGKTTYSLKATEVAAPAAPEASAPEAQTEQPSAPAPEVTEVPVDAHVETAQ